MAEEKMSELDRLSLALIEEKKGRLKAEAINLSMMQRGIAARHEELDKESNVLSARLKEAYKLEPNDEILADGTIKRSNVREIKTAQEG